MIDVYAIKDVEKNRIECNNINLNLNGLDINTVPEPFSSLLQDIQTLPEKEQDKG